MVVFFKNTSTDCTGIGGGRRNAHSSRWRNLHLARAVFPECDMFVAVPGDCFRLHCWVKQQKGKNLRLVCISTQISKHNLSSSDFSYLQNSGGTIMRMESNDLDDHQTFLADARKPQTLFFHMKILREVLPHIQFWKILVVWSLSFSPKTIMY